MGGGPSKDEVLDAQKKKHAPVKVQEEKKNKKKEKKKWKKVDDNKAMRLLDKRGRMTYGWGEWEPYMQFLESLDGPAIMSVAYEDDMDSGAWAGEAPNELAMDRFWGERILKT